MAAAEFDAGRLDDGVFRMECTVSQFVWFLYMHDFVNGAVHLEESGIDQRSVADTSDNGHLGSADNMGVQSAVLYQVFNPVYIFFSGMWF